MRIIHPLYTTDHDGLVIKLATDKFDIPAEQRGETLALAQQKRVEAGAEYAKAKHLKAALEELGLPLERKTLLDHSLVQADSTNPTRTER